MRSANEHRDSEDSEQLHSYRELQLLSEVEGNPEITQRVLSKRMGIALGLTNVLLRNLAQKGYVRITQAGWKRWLYTLTPEGFSQKLRLTVAYIHRFLHDYQRVRQTLRVQLEPLALNVESRVAIYGTGEFAELVYLGLKDIGIEEIDVFGSENPPGETFLGMPVHDVATLNPAQYDRVMVGFLDGSKASYLALREREVEPEKLITFFTDAEAKGVV